MIRLDPPFTEEKIRSLKVGDMVEISGLIFTGRDAVHKWLSEGNEPPKGEVDLRDSIIYHCGPVVMEKGSGAKKKYVVTAAGPTTSIREEPYQAGLIERFGMKAVIGKGGMGEKTRLACEKFGCVYLHAVGGAAQVLAEAIKEVEGVYGLEKFGSPEAIWKLRVEKFPVVVTIDAHGNSLHKEIEANSGETLQGIYADINDQAAKAKAQKATGKK
jgi:fumarate hydratase subunit beta